MPSGRPPRSAYAANADVGGDGHAALLQQTQPSPSRGGSQTASVHLCHCSLASCTVCIAYAELEAVLTNSLFLSAGMLSFLRRGGGDGSDPDLNGRHAAALDEMDRCTMCMYLSLANASSE
jgi:hypothetical protein